MNRRIWLAALALPMGAEAAGAPDSTAMTAGFQPMAFLAGSCWKGTFPDGKQTDEHCFEWMYGGKFLRDRHVVGAGPYGGETIYFWDPEARAVSYAYFNADGGVSRGQMHPRNGALEFPEERYRSEAGEQVYRSRWQRDGSDAYLVLTERQTASGWTEAWRMRLARQAPRRP